MITIKINEDTARGRKLLRELASEPENVVSMEIPGIGFVDPNNLSDQFRPFEELEGYIKERYRKKYGVRMK